VNKKSSTRRLSYLQVAVVIFKRTDRQAKSLKQMKCSARCLLPEVAMGERWPTCDACRLRLDYFRLFPKNQLDPMHMNPGKKVWLWNTSWRQAKNKLRVTAWKVQTFSDELNLKNVYLECREYIYIYSNVLFGPGFFGWKCKTLYIDDRISRRVQSYIMSRHDHFIKTVSRSG